MIPGKEHICRLQCRWYQEGECTAALGGFDDNGHCPCRAHEWEHNEEPILSRVSDNNRRESVPGAFGDRGGDGTESRNLLRLRSD